MNNFVNTYWLPDKFDERGFAFCSFIYTNCKRADNNDEARDKPKTKLIYQQQVKNTLKFFWERKMFYGI